MNTAKHAEANRALVSLLLINVLVGCATGILHMAIPLYSLSLQATTVQLGFIAGANGIGRLLVVIPSGLLIDRYGARSLFIKSTLLSIVATLALILVRSPMLLMVVLFFQSMGQSVGFLALQAGFLKRLPYLDAGRSGWQRGATQIGFYLIGPIACGLLLQDNRFAAAFLTVSTILAGGLLISWYRRRRGASEVKEPSPESDHGELARLKSLLSNRILVQVLTIECIGSAAFTIFRAFVAPVAIEILKLPLRDVSCLIISQGVMAMVVLLAGGGLVRRFLVTRVYLASGMLVTAGSSLLATASGFWPFWLGAVVFGCGTGMMSLCSLSRIAQVVGEKGKIAALFSFSVGIGSTLGPILAGVVGERLTVQAVFLTTLPFILLSWLLFAPESRRKESSPDPVELAE